MHTVAILSFYGFLSFWCVSGLIFLYRIGRLGPAQTRRLEEKLPPRPRLSRDDAEELVGLAGIPTSLADIFVSATPVGTVKTYGSLVQLIARDPKLAFAAVIVGRRFGLILYISAICLLALQCLLLLKGVAYRPLWIAQPGGATVIAVAGLLAACFIAYITGKRVGSPISSFNAARLSCDRIVSSHGYWFDNRHDPDHYKDDHNFLLGALRDYERLLNALDEAPESEFSRYNTMVVHYQRALLLATLARYDDALAALSNARQLKESLSGSTMWDPNEEPEFESRICFLEGELLLVGGDRERARALFLQSRQIGQELGDSAGVEETDARLTQIQE